MCGTTMKLHGEQDGGSARSEECNVHRGSREWDSREGTEGRRTRAILRPVHTARADATKPPSFVASAVVGDSLRESREV